MSRFGFVTGNASSTSEFVRQELRAIVGARTQQQQQQRIPNNIQNNLSGQVSQDDLEALGLTFEMSSAGTSSSAERRNVRFPLFESRACRS